MPKNVQWEGEHSAYYTSNPIDLYYLTGQTFSKGELFLHEKGNFLILDGRYFEAASTLQGFKVIPEGEKVLQEVVKGFGGGKIFLNFQSIPHAEFLQLEKSLKGHELVHSTWLEKVRAIKTPEEIAMMKKSASLNHEGQKFVRTHLKEGISEKEVSWLFEKFVREHGGDSLSFVSIVAFGENSSKPHHRAGERRLKKGDAVTVDSGVTIREYMSDATRSYFFGDPPAEYVKMEKNVMEAVQLGFSLCKPGVSLHSVDAAVRELFSKRGVLPFFKHNLGHSLGLEIHEYPRFSPKTDPSVLLEVGMCVTIEPGLYYDGKWGYRYEDTIVITKNGMENLYV